MRLCPSDLGDTATHCSLESAWSSSSCSKNAMYNVPRDIMATQHFSADSLPQQESSEPDKSLRVRAFYHCARYSSFYVGPARHLIGGRAKMAGRRKSAFGAINQVFRKDRDIRELRENDKTDAVQSTTSAQGEARTVQSLDMRSATSVSTFSFHPLQSQPSTTEATVAAGTCHHE